MRRTEALQGVRVIKFLDILSRYDAADLSGLEAAELLGIGERTFRRWRRRHIAVLPSRPSRQARPSRRSPGSICMRFYESRKSARSATTIASRPTGSSCKSPRARCVPISSRRASSCGTIPSAPTQSFTLATATVAAET